MSEIYIFRHGNSRANASRDRTLPCGNMFSVARRWLGYDAALKMVQRFDALRNKCTPFEVKDRDIPLTEIGYNQARLTGKEVAALGILPDLLLVSTYRRTRETAAGILAGIQEVTEQDFSRLVLLTDIIVERKSGYTSGFPRAYFGVLFPEVDRAYRNGNKIDFRPPGGESIYDVRFKRIPGLHDILGRISFATLFIVGHGITNTCIRSLLTGEDIYKIRLGSPNLGVYHFIQADGKDQPWVLDPKLDGSEPISSAIPRTE